MRFAISYVFRTIACHAGCGALPRPPDRRPIPAPAPCGGHQYGGAEMATAGPGCAGSVVAAVGGLAPGQPGDSHMPVGESRSAPASSTAVGWVITLFTINRFRPVTHRSAALLYSFPSFFVFLRQALALSAAANPAELEWPPSTPAPGPGSRSTDTRYRSAPARAATLERQRRVSSASFARCRAAPVPPSCSATVAPARIT